MKFVGLPMIMFCLFCLKRVLCELLFVYFTSNHPHNLDINQEIASKRNAKNNKCNKAKAVQPILDNIDMLTSVIMVTCLTFYVELIIIYFLEGI